MMCLRNPKMRGLMIRKVRDTLSNTGLVTYREHVAKESMARGRVLLRRVGEWSPRNSVQQWRDSL
jgi:hypothetical protein